ncbi:MAG: YraN family protein [Asticcacaulis sp.]
MNRRAEKGLRAHRRGHLSEYIALIHLMLKGYRILGFRLKTPEAEIDILAQKGRRLAVIEVKQRRSVLEALHATGPVQQARLRQAAQKLIARRTHLRKFDLEIDLYVLPRRGWPQHVRNIFHEGA